MTKYIFLIMHICAYIFSIQYSQAQITNNKIAVVPDSNTAKKIAEVLLIRYYGIKVQNKFPLKVTENKDKTVWIIRGTLEKPKSKDIVVMGGVPYIEIRKTDCCILKITHGK